MTKTKEAILTALLDQIPSEKRVYVDQLCNDTVTAQHAEALSQLSPWLSLKDRCILLDIDYSDKIENLVSLPDYKNNMVEDIEEGCGKLIEELYERTISNKCDWKKDNNGASVIFEYSKLKISAPLCGEVLVIKTLDDKIIMKISDPTYSKLFFSIKRINKIANNIANDAYTAVENITNELIATVH